VKTLLIILGEFLHTLNVKQLASIRDGFKCLVERITTPLADTTVSYGADLILSPILYICVQRISQPTRTSSPQIEKGKASLVPPREYGNED
jgi:hypothetical protein